MLKVFSKIFAKKGQKLTKPTIFLCGYLNFFILPLNESLKLTNNRTKTDHL
jgi:hypothetical protein